MTPQAEQIITRAIREVNDKVLYETEVKAREDGIKEGRREGKVETLEEIAKNLKDTFDDYEISKRTGLSVERIREL